MIALGPQTVLTACEDGVRCDIDFGVVKDDSVIGKANVCQIDGGYLIQLKSECGVDLKRINRALDLMRHVQLCVHKISTAVEPFFSVCLR